MFFKFIIRALKYRKQRLLLAFAALAVAAALATVLFGTYGTVERRLRDEFRAYGANITAVPVGGTTVPIEVVAAAERLGANAAPFVVNGEQVGFIPAKTEPLTSFWHVQGSRTPAPGECLAGELMNLSIGASYKGCRVVGIVATGGPEDQQIFSPLGETSLANYVQIRAPGDRMDQIRSQLSGQFPTVDFRSIRAVTNTENAVVLKIRASLLALTLVILVITTLCVTGNFTEMVLERAKEIAILKALGAAERRIAAFFISESAALALAATLVGYVAGVFAAAAIGRQIFGGAFRLQPDAMVFAGVIVVMLVVATTATAIAAARIWSIEPAMILRGE